MPWQSFSNSNPLPPPSLPSHSLLQTIWRWSLDLWRRLFWARHELSNSHNMTSCETMLATSFQFNLNWQQLINIYNMQSIITEWKTVREREREKEAELENRINIQNNANFACHCYCCCCCNCKRETRRLRKVSQREDNAVYLIDAPHCIAPEQHWAAKPQATASALGLCLPPSHPSSSLTLFQLWQTVVTV